MVKNIFYCIFLLVISDLVFAQNDIKTKNFELIVLDISSQKRQTIELAKNNLLMIKDSSTGKEFSCSGYTVEEFNSKSSGKKDYFISANACFYDSNKDMWRLGFTVENVPFINSEEQYYQIIVLLGYLSHGKFNDQFPEIKFFYKGRVEDIFANKAGIFQINQMKMKNGKEFSISIGVKN